MLQSVKALSWNLMIILNFQSTSWNLVLYPFSFIPVTTSIHPICLHWKKLGHTFIFINKHRLPNKVHNIESGFPIYHAIQIFLSICLHHTLQSLRCYTELMTYIVCLQISPQIHFHFKCFPVQTWPHNNCKVFFFSKALQLRYQEEALDMD